MIEFNMPSLGADMADGTLTEWRVKQGDFVKRGDIIADVDTQKGLIEIEVFDEGTIGQLVIKEGDKVPVGTVMAMIIPPNGEVKEDAETSFESEVFSLEQIREKVLMNKTDTAVIPEKKKALKISPLARKMAKDAGIDITNIKGSGPQGSIVQKDLEQLIETNGDKETVLIQPMDIQKEADTKNLRGAIAAAMSKSNSEIPHFYLETKTDLSKALEWLKEMNLQKDIKNRLLPVVLLIKATALALKEVPEVNATWENGLQLKKAVNIGFAISLRSGGVVIPAILNADQKSLDELMVLLNDLIPRAKKLKLRSSELSESTITLTNIGEGSVDKVYGVIYPPQVAIVGFGRIAQEPWAENNALSIRSVVHISLAADHRAIDGHLGGKFLTTIANYLQSPERL